MNSIDTTTSGATSNPASKERLYQLHACLLDALLDGFGGAKAPKASFLMVARSFLRDNGISKGDKVGAQEMQSALEGLKSLPFTGMNAQPGSLHSDEEADLELTKAPFQIDDDLDF